MYHIEKKTFQLYLDLLQSQEVNLTEKERELLNFLGVTLTLSNKKYLITDSSQYHLPYQKKLFPAELHAILRLEEIISSTLDIIPTKPQQLIIAEAQTIGRGQYERRWYSALGRQILLTYHLESYVRPLDAIWALWKVLEPFGIAFKWPNDLYNASGKIAGALSHQKESRSSVSFGLNLSLDAQWPLGSLSASPSIISREQLIVSWLEAFHLAKNISQEEIAGALSSASMIREFEEVFFNHKVYLFNGLSDSGAMKLLDKNSSKVTLVVSGSIRPVDPRGWFFQQNAQNSCGEQKK